MPSRQSLSKSRSKQAPVASHGEFPPPYQMPAREWLRATEIIRMFAMTGFVGGKGCRPQSVLLISEPGSGKTELLDRFNQNPFLQYASDVTTRGLFPILKMAKQGACTHVVATEFQKFFLRKSATAEATLGTFCQMMEEGVGVVRVGDKMLDFGGAQVGLIGAITHDTAAKWTGALRELGFWSRCAAFQWDMPLEEMRQTMRSISAQDRSDLEPVLLRVPESKVPVDFPVALSEQFEDYTFKRYREYPVLRVFSRFRVLAMACALLEGRDVVAAYDVEKVVAFDPYWSRMQK